jgi:hypothetical protein
MTRIGGRWVTLHIAALAAIISFGQAGLYAASPKSSAAAPRPQDSEAASQQKSAYDQVVDRIVKREHDEMKAFARYRPVVETYIQQLAPDKLMGEVPVHDAYYLGQADLSQGISVRSMLPKVSGRFNLLGFTGSGDDAQPDGFVQMIYLDRDNFDRQHYQFRYRGRDFLGEIRCYVFDVIPTKEAGKGSFEGRIWVEDRDFTIVRFNGTYVPLRKLPSLNFVPHFDSWRVNAQPGLWLPACVFVEGLNDKPGKMPRYKAQTRLWAYSPEAADQQADFSKLSIESTAPVQDDSAQENESAPVEAQRGFDREAEDNAIDTLVRAGIIAPEGPVDKVLNTVLNNLEVTNNLNITPEPRCRVMLTSNIELFSIGHTIVLSRGLIDVIPDESTLAVMLAQELSDAMILKPQTSEYGFSDILETPTTQALRAFSFKDEQNDWQAIGAKTIEILKNSPYKGKLGSAGLFLKQLSLEYKTLPHLVGAHLGNRVYPVDALISSSPQLQPDKIDQIAALPMGSRVKVDPWNDQAQMLKTAPVALMSAREKMPFEITPFMPYLRRYKEAHAADVAAPKDQSAPQ